MAKELTHRGDELKDLGWSSHDEVRYIELWDYRQRWGAINLEREDRLFLRKVEASLPEVKSSKTSIKKPLKEKSYYCRILFFLQEMLEAEKSFSASPNSKGIWSILLEEELRTLDYFQPVLGLPDTLKSKLLIPFRENIINSLKKKFNNNIKIFDFDFDKSLSTCDSIQSRNWKPLRDGISEEAKDYPVLDSEIVEECRSLIRKEIVPLIRNSFPSLSDLEKDNPPDDWIPDS